MSIQVFTDAKVYVGGYNLSGYANETHITQTPAVLDATTFGNATKIGVAGVKDFKADVGGFMDFAFPIGAAPLDQNNSFNSALYSMIGGAINVASIAPLGNSEGDLAFTLQHVASKFDPMGGAHGALMPFKLEMMAAGVKVIRGSVMGVGNKTVTGGTASPLNIVGGVLSGQSLYLGFHVVGASGTTPTLNVIVRSAAASNMTSPTTRLTVPQYTTSVGASWLSVAGPITDQWYDVRWTITGTTPNYTIFAVLGVG